MIKVTGSQLHDACLQWIPPPFPSKPNNPVVSCSTVVPTGVVQAIEMGRVASREWRNNTFLPVRTVRSKCFVWLDCQTLMMKLLLVEPPASFVFLCTVAFVVVVVLVVGAEPHALMAGPPRHANLMTSRQGISSCTCIHSKGKLVEFLQWGTNQKQLRVKAFAKHFTQPLKEMTMNTIGLLLFHLLLWSWYIQRHAGDHQSLPSWSSKNNFLKAENIRKKCKLLWV